MQPRWLRGLDEQEQTNLKDEYKRGIILRDRLVALLEDDINKSMMEMRDAARGGVINLTEYYTDELARQRTLEDVIKLIKE